MGAYFYHPDVGQFDFRVDPNSCKWSYNIRTHEDETYGGKVIQILGIDIGLMQIVGEFGDGGFPEQERMVVYVRNCMTALKKQHTRFVFPFKGWDMQGWFTGYPKYYLDRTTVSPAFTVPFFVAVENGALTKIAMNEALKKVQIGIGWDDSEKYSAPPSSDSQVTQAALDKNFQFWKSYLNSSNPDYSVIAPEIGGMTPGEMANIQSATDSLNQTITTNTKPSGSP